jgi:hypothetical protein
VPRSSWIELTADVTVTEAETEGGSGTESRRRATAFITLERATTDTGWRLVTFSLGPRL